jgi:hypothetical protein
MARTNRNSVTTRGTMAVAGGASTLTAAGGIAAQLPPDAGLMPSLLLFGISGALALLTVLTKLYEIHCRRTPEYIAATTLAHVARRHTDPDRSMRLALLDRALARDSDLTPAQLAALLTNSQLADLPPPSPDRGPSHC